MRRIVEHGRIEGGKLIINRERLAAQIAAAPNGEVVLKIQGQTRSQKLNRVYWMYLTMLEDITGYSRTELHEEFKRKFNARTVSDIDPATGEIIDVAESSASTTDLDNPQMVAYIEDIRRFSAEFFGVVLPDPTGPGA